MMEAHDADWQTRADSEKGDAFVERDEVSAVVAKYEKARDALRPER